MYTYIQSLNRDRNLQLWLQLIDRRIARHTGRRLWLWPHTDSTCSAADADAAARCAIPAIQKTRLSYHRHGSSGHACLWRWCGSAMFFERRIGGLQSRCGFCIVVACSGTVVVIIIVVIAVGRQSGFCISSVTEKAFT